MLRSFAQSCLTLYNPVGCSLPGFSVHGTLQARMLECVAMPSYRGSSQPRDQPCVSYVFCVGRWFFFFFFFTTSATWKAHLELYSCIFLIWLFIEIDCPFSGQLLHLVWRGWRLCSFAFSSVQLLSCIWLLLMSMESVMPFNYLILCCPLLLLPSIFPSIRVFSSESVLPIRGPKYWSFSFNIRYCSSKW